MNVPIQHIIGTVAIIGLVLTTGLAYSIITSFVEMDLKKQQLKQISENVALNIVEMSNLVRFANYTNKPMMKIVDLPVDLGGSTYTVELVDGTAEGEGYFVRANLTSNEHVTATSLIPVNAGQKLILYTNSTTTSMIVGFENTNITCSGTVYGKDGTVVWGITLLEVGPDDSAVESVEVGIGWLT